MRAAATRALWATAATALWATAAACRAPAPPPRAPPATVTARAPELAGALDPATATARAPELANASLEALRVQFNHEVGRPRLLALVSPS